MGKSPGAGFGRRQGVKTERMAGTAACLGQAGRTSFKPETGGTERPHGRASHGVDADRKVTQG